MLIRSVPSLSPPVRAPITATPIVLQTSASPRPMWRAGCSRSGAWCAPSTASICSLRRGETLGVVGESGSGKSTVARCIARLIEPTDGAILIEGADVAKLGARALRPHRKRVQIVFQDPYRSLNPRRTVGAAIAEGPLNFGMAEKEARRARAGTDASGRPRPGRARALPAPVLRRPAPAHLHRAGARDGAGDPGRRRAGLGARRVGAGAGARTDRRRAQALQSGGAVHHPRSARRRAGLRPHRRDAQGRGGRGRHDGGRVRRAEARLHPGAVRSAPGKNFEFGKFEI